MHTRILIADQYEARFYDVERRDGPWEVAERMMHIAPASEDDVMFARRIVAALERGRRQLRFEQLILVAASPFLDTLRVELPCDLQHRICAVIPKNLVRQTQSTLQGHIPPQAFPPSAPVSICRDAPQAGRPTPAVVDSRSPANIRGMFAGVRQWPIFGVRYGGRQLAEE